MYDFLAAYRTVPLIFLPTEEQLRESINQIKRDRDDREKSDLTDEEIQEILATRTRELTRNLFPTYQNLIPKVIEKVLQADESKALDEFMMKL